MPDGETRAALVVVSGFERGDAVGPPGPGLRRPEDGEPRATAAQPGAAAPELPKRWRGRPPASRDATG